MVSRYAGRSSSDTTSGSSTSSSSRSGRSRPAQTAAAADIVRACPEVSGSRAESRGFSTSVRRIDRHSNRAQLRARAEEERIRDAYIRVPARSAANRTAGSPSSISIRSASSCVRHRRAGTGRPKGRVSEYALASPVNQRYLAAKRARPEGDVYVSVYVATNRSRIHKETQDHPVILLDVIDAVPIETGWSRSMRPRWPKDISSTGHVALYGIYFDTDKADLKPESQPALEEIAKLLKQDPSLKLYVVGHTDNVGAYDYNIGLSERRAAAVVKELTAKHGIAAARLKPAGVGMLSPVAPNDSEEGRAKNRRVELVKQ